MARQQNPGHQADSNEQQRLTIATIIASAILALYALTGHSNDLWTATRGFSVFPGILAFIYILLTGVSLKYKEPGYFGEMFIPQHLRHVMFDWSVGVFWYGFLLSLMLFVAAAFGWDGRRLAGKFWVGFASAIVIWILLFIAGLVVARKGTKKGR